MRTIKRGKHRNKKIEGYYDERGVETFWFVVSILVISGVLLLIDALIPGGL